MKLKITALIVVVLSLQFSLSAQKLNTWSIDAFAGTSFIGGAMQSIGHKGEFPGYYSESIAPLHISLGATKMLTPTFGVRIEASYDNIKSDNNSQDFEATFWGLKAQGVMNMGRLLSFEQFTKKFNVFFNGGFGVSSMSLNEDYATIYDGSNWDPALTASFGGWVAYKLTKKLSINAGYSYTMLAELQTALDGSRKTFGRIDGEIHNFRAGLAYDIGKNKEHISWAIASDELVEESVDPNAEKLAAIETELDNLKNQLAQYQNNTSHTGGGADQDIPKVLLEEGYLSVFFDFDKSVPTKETSENLEFALNYLKRNPSVKMKLIGYADELGTDEYNNKLAQKRADNVKKALVEAGVDASRLTAVSAGEDKSVDPNSDWARSLVRRVLFVIN